MLNEYEAAECAEPVERIYREKIGDEYEVLIDSVRLTFATIDQAGVSAK
jgi:hypothetical protein